MVSLVHLLCVRRQHAFENELTWSQVFRSGLSTPESTMVYSRTKLVLSTHTY